MFTRCIVVALCIFPLACLLGCNTSDSIEVADVSGSVRYQGKPVDGALITFRPKGAERSASGYTEADGTFLLSTAGSDKPGAVVGQYDVLISKEVEVDQQGNPIQRNSGAYDPAAGPQTAPAGWKSLVPTKYNATDKPIISAEVKDGKNSFEFDLTD